MVKVKKTWTLRGPKITKKKIFQKNKQTWGNKYYSKKYNSLPPNKFNREIYFLLKHIVGSVSTLLIIIGTL